MKDTMQLTSNQPVPVRVQPDCSADLMRQQRQSEYSKGYAAGIKRLNILKDEIARLRQIKTTVQPDSHDEAVEYLISTAEALASSAALLIEMRTGYSPQNAPDEPHAKNL